jgi:hypothetical protein
MRYLILIPIVFMLGACSYLEKAEDKGAEYAGKAIVKYCEETDENVRGSFRDKVNHYAMPHTAQINCAPE